MILVTVGTQLPFDRLVRTVDAWALQTKTSDVLAQIGAAAWRPKNIRWVVSLHPEEFRKAAQGARAIIAHAGTGSVLAAMEYQKPIVIMPRRAALGEHRNEHQMATARQFQCLPSVTVAWTETELTAVLDRLDSLSGEYESEPFAPQGTTSALRERLAQPAQFWARNGRLRWLRRVASAR